MEIYGKNFSGTRFYLSALLFHTVFHTYGRNHSVTDFLQGLHLFCWWNQKSVWICFGVKFFLFSVFLNTACSGSVCGLFECACSSRLDDLLRNLYAQEPYLKSPSGKTADGLSFFKMTEISNPIIHHAALVLFLRKGFAACSCLILSTCFSFTSPCFFHFSLVFLYSERKYTDAVSFLYAA